MGMADDLQMLQMLRNFQLPPDLPPQGYQPLEPPQGPPPALSPYQQFGQKLQPIAPYLPLGRLMSQEAEPYPGRQAPETMPEQMPGTLPRNRRDWREELRGQALGAGIRGFYRFGQ